MGRTLRYKITKEDEKSFSNQELDAMHQISIKYNSRKFRKVWTCENLWIDPVDYFPNWYTSDKIKELNKVSRKAVWKFIQENVEANEVETGSRIKAVLKAVKDGYIILHRDGWRKQVRGFVKTQSNELNSLLVYTGLLELSILCPKLKIHLSDEGEFLLANLYIQNGKVLPDLADIKEDVDRWSRELAVKECKYQERFAEEYAMLGEDGTRNLNIDGTYADMAEKYLKQSLRKYARALLILKEHVKVEDKTGWGFQFNDSNISNIDPKNWVDPMLYCRPVNVGDFYDYEGGVPKLVDGFEGEYWGLSDEDSEAKGYRMIAQMQKIFGKKNMAILPKLDDEQIAQIALIKEDEPVAEEKKRKKRL